MRSESSFYPALRRVILRMDKIRSKYDGTEVVVVGYAQPYAIFVHEAVAMRLKGVPRSKSKYRPSIGRYWDPPGAQAKFLEKAGRESTKWIAKDVAKELKQGSTLTNALLKAGRKIQYISQKMVPVDFGALIASAYTCTEREETQVAATALQRSTFLRPEPKDQLA